MTTRKVASSKLRLTNASVDALMRQPAGTHFRRYWDTDFPPLNLQFTKRGVATYYLRYPKADGSKGDYAIGRADLVSASAAREVARAKMSALVLHGTDPVDERRAKRQEAAAAEEKTFAAIAAGYMASKAKARPGKPPLQENFFLEKYVMPALGKRDAGTVTEQDVIDLLNDIRAGVQRRNSRKNATGKTTANNCHKAIKRVYRWAMRSGTLTANPADFERQFNHKPAKRKGRLNEERFAIFWSELVKRYHSGPGRGFGPLATLIYMTTLQRPIDVARARRADFDFATRTWTIPGDRTKTENDYFIPLSDVAMALVQEAFRRTDSEWLFPKTNGRRDGHTSSNTLTRTWCDVRADCADRLDVRDITLYDCRRFGRTQIRHKLKFDKDVAEAVINHVDSGKIDTLYDVHDFDVQVRQAQEGWGDEIMKMVGYTDLDIFNGEDL